MTNLMIDLETFGTKDNAPIASAGMAIFNQTDIEATYYRVVDVGSYEPESFQVDPKTLKWWLSGRADVLLEMQSSESKVEIKQLLISVIEVYQTHKCQTVWSHGSNFDIPILQHWFNVFGLKEPWGFRDIRDTRTVYDLAGEVPSQPEENKHHALNDAIAQARAVQRSLAKFGFR